MLYLIFILPSLPYVLLACTCTCTCVGCNSGISLCMLVYLRTSLSSSSFHSLSSLLTGVGMAIICFLVLFFDIQLPNELKGFLFYAQVSSTDQQNLFFPIFKNTGYCPAYQEFKKKYWMCRILRHIYIRCVVSSPDNHEITDVF